jgi:outer membrane immunogenic protein
MKTVVMASLAFIASAGAALAADAQPVVTPGPFQAPPAYPAGQGHWWGPAVTPGPFDPPPAYTPRRVYDWTGFYVGLNGGGSFGRMVATSDVTNISSGSNLSGGLVGGTVGYNLQTGDPFVVGMEGDLDWADIKGTTPATICAPGCELKIPWLATARLRFGYALFDAVLPYVAGGAAIANLSAQIAGAPLGTATTTNLGWTLGGGVEFVISGPLRAKVEYLYVNLNGFTCNTACNTVSFIEHSSVIRAGLNYKLWTN